MATLGEHGEAVPDRPDDDACDPLLQAEPDRRGQRAVDDRKAPRGAAEQDRRSEAPMNGNLEALNMAAGTMYGDVHAISAPPPKLKKDRKKLDAAKAIERPKMIWMSRRKPPAVSPNASVRPVTMMLITAMLFATGPCPESCNLSTGFSHSLPVPARRVFARTPMLNPTPS